MKSVLLRIDATSVLKTIIDIKAVVWTQAISEMQIAELRELGGFDYFIKPLSFDGYIDIARDIKYKIAN